MFPFKDYGAGLALGIETESPERSEDLQCKARAEGNATMILDLRITI